MEEKNVTCIVCPNSCEMRIKITKDKYEVSGNGCIRGRDFAINEITNPKRTLCSTVKTTSVNLPRLSVRTDGEIPKDAMKEVMVELSKITIDHSIFIGQIVLENVLNTGVNIIATSNFTFRGDEVGE